MKSLLLLLSIISSSAFAANDYICSYDRTKGSNHRVGVFKVSVSDFSMAVEEKIITTKITSGKKTILQSSVSGQPNIQSTMRGAPGSMKSYMSYHLTGKYSYVFENSPEYGLSLIIYRVYLPQLKAGQDVVTWSDLSERSSLHKMTANRVQCKLQ